MSTATNVAQWSTTAADNSNADSGLPVMSDTMDPIGLDNVPRGMMAAIAKWRKDFGGAIEAGGTANALTASTSSGLEAAHLADGLMIAVKAAADNTNATVTINVDSTGAKAVKRADGSALAVGSIKAGQILLLFYDADDANWRAANIAPGVVGTAAGYDVGTSGAKVPLLDGNNAWSGTAAFSGAVTFSGAVAMNAGGTIGDASGDAVIIKGTTVSAFVAGLLSASDAAAFRTAIGLGTIATEDAPLATNKGGTGVAGAAGGLRNLMNSISETKGGIWYHNGTFWTVLNPP